MKTTLKEIRKHHPCIGGWKKLLKKLNKTKPDDEPLPLLTVFESNGFKDTLWCLEKLYGHKELVKLGLLFVKEIEHLMPEESVKALAVFERYVDGKATYGEFSAACNAARLAYSATEPSNYCADAAAYAALATSAATYIEIDYAAAYAALAAAHSHYPYNSYNANTKSEMQEKQIQILRKFLKANLV